MTNYTVTLNCAQLVALRNACEWIGRLNMGQFDILKEICYKKDVSVEYDEFKEVEQQLKQILYPDLVPYSSYYGIASEQTGETAKILWDIYQSIRQFISLNDSLIDEHFTISYDNPLHTSNEPLIKIKTEDDKNNDIYIDFFRRFRGTIHQKTMDMSPDQKQEFIEKCKSFAIMEDLHVNKFCKMVPSEKYDELFDIK